MAITRVNKLGTASSLSTGLSSLVLTVTATTTAHNRIIVGIIWAANNPTATVTDSQGNIYTQDASASSGTTATFGRVFSARADNPLTSGVDTITITWTGQTANLPMMAAYEYSGLANFLPQDAVTTATATSASPNSGPATTQFANELIFGLIGWNSNSAISSPSFTELDHLSTTNRSLETQEGIVAATGSYAVSATISGTPPTWISIVSTYADTANPASGAVTSSTAPTITGSGVVGMQLTCSQGFWTNLPTAYSYQWKRNGSNIVGATGAHYLVTAVDVGHVLSCAVTASNKFGSVTVAASNTVTPSVNKIATGLGI